LKQLAAYLVLIVVCVVGLEVPSAAEEPSVTSENLLVTGTLICLDKTQKETGCGVKNEGYGIKTSAGQIYALQKHENVEALHAEKRLKTREFRLTLRKEPNSTFYEVVKSQFIRDGQVYDFHYFCEVCNITTHAPGLCMCCRQDTEYRENLAR
jgi:hypothetical protein